MKRLFIKVYGIVQGVGFRPFVYNLACSNHLNGWVNNNSEGVYIDLEGSDASINKFLDILTHYPPPLAKIENVVKRDMPLKSYTSFTIKESNTDKNKITLISPDISICNDCLKDILDPSNRRYRYAFTNCTNCGPRFTIIKSIPYDRDKTTMGKFNMCKDCNEEYKNPLNRRFHAQPNACNICGPSLWVTDNKGNKIITEDPLNFTIDKIKEGKIFAIKGLGGFHLVCDGKNEESIQTLRIRKNRPHKPFALMMKDLETVKKYCFITPKEEELITGAIKPIVLLNKNFQNPLPENIAPNQKTLGIMLPYTPLHYLLFQKEINTLIMTSANMHSLPLEYKNNSAVEKLSTIVDYFLMHDRDIFVPIDDSVTKVINEEELILRRARGYVPKAIKALQTEDILACGTNMKNTFCISKDNFLFLSQHNGDLENLETIEHFKRNIEHFKNIFLFTPKYIACDIHPNYYSTLYAESYNLPLIKAQHHHAHIVSCMVENNISSNVIGLSFDGTGYGTDDNIWGGEFLLCNYKSFKRLAHLEYIPMTGGDKSIIEPWRMGVSLIYNAFKDKNKALKNITKLYGNKGIFLANMIEKHVNTIQTSSMGRLFDGVSSLIGVRNEITYEGQASIELESLVSSNNDTDSYPYEICLESDTYIIKTNKIIKQVLKDRLNNVSQEKMSLKFHNTIIKLSFEMCKILSSITGIKEFALSGGVFQNSYLLSKLELILKQNGFIVYTHKTIPCNDGGVSLGQLVIANSNLHL